MDWGSLIGPAVVAAGVSGVISIISIVVTVAQPDEKGAGRGEAAPSVNIDIAAKNLLDLTAQLGA